MGACFVHFKEDLTFDKDSTLDLERELCEQNVSAKSNVVNE